MPRILRQLPSLLVALALLLGPPRAGMSIASLRGGGPEQEERSDDTTDSKDAKEDGKESESTLSAELLASLPRSLQGARRRASGTELLLRFDERRTPLAAPPSPAPPRPSEYLPRLQI